MPGALHERSGAKVGEHGGVHGVTARRYSYIQISDILMSLVLTPRPKQGLKYGTPNSMGGYWASWGPFWRPILGSLVYLFKCIYIYIHIDKGYSKKRVP